MANNKGVHVATPPGGESVMHLEPTKEDRAQYVKEFREEKKHQDKIKDERFAEIQARRKKHGPGGGGGGINVEVTSDS